MEGKRWNAIDEKLMVGQEMEVIDGVDVREGMWKDAIASNRIIVGTNLNFFLSINESKLNNSSRVFWRGVPVNSNWYSMLYWSKTRKNCIGMAKYNMVKLFKTL